MEDEPNPEALVDHRPNVPPSTALGRQRLHVVYHYRHSPATRGVNFTLPRFSLNRTTSTSRTMPSYIRGYGHNG